MIIDYHRMLLLLHGMIVVDRKNHLSILLLLLLIDKEHWNLWMTTTSSTVIIIVPVMMMNKLKNVVAMMMHVLLLLLLLLLLWMMLIQRSKMMMMMNLNNSCIKLLLLLLLSIHHRRRRCRESGCVRYFSRKRKRRDILPVSQLEKIVLRRWKDLQVPMAQHVAIARPSEIRVVFGHHLDEGVAGEPAVVAVVDQMDSIWSERDSAQEVGDRRFGRGKGKAADSDDREPVAEHNGRMIRSCCWICC